MIHDTEHSAGAQAAAEKAEERECGRLEAFSDGVFAIAMTLLAFNLKIPDTHGGGMRELAHQLALQWPSYLAFVTSFFTVLIIWVNHHAMFRLIHRVNTRLLFANGILLMMTTTVPFTSQLVAEYLRTPAGKTACAVYGGMYVLMSMAYNLTWRNAIRGRMLVSRRTSEEVIGRITHTYRYGTPAYLLATAGAFVNVYITMGICTAMWIYWVYTIRDA
jgi:uncharacterized membrane protein